MGSFTDHIEEFINRFDVLNKEQMRCWMEDKSHEILLVESLRPLDMEDIVLNELPVNVESKVSPEGPPDILSFDLPRPYQSPAPSPAPPTQQQHYEKMGIHGLRYELAELMFEMSQLRASEGCRYIVEPLDGECYLVVGLARDMNRLREKIAEMRRIRGIVFLLELF